jgi:hypothetical protein
MPDILALHCSHRGSVRTLAEAENRPAFIHGQRISNLAKKSSRP